VIDTTTISSLFAHSVDRRIEEVIKVDQTDEHVIGEELDEYVVTSSIRSNLHKVLDQYWITPNNPHEGIGVWVSGFFGSGKSSFAKYLGLGLENRPVLGRGAGERLGERTGDKTVQLLLRNIAERIPTEAVIFDVSTDRGIRSGNQTITEIMYRLFLRALGYASDLDLAELEITLEAEGRLAAFEERYRTTYKKEWNEGKGLVALAVGQASRVMHELDPATFPTPDSWRASALRRADITPGLLAERCRELMHRRRPGKSVVFVIDEVGQFVARDIQKMLDLQAVVQSLGRVGRGQMWLMVTSQERLNDLVGGLDDKRVELARLIDRFPLQVHLEPSDISEVTSRRVLSKHAEAERALRDLFERHRGRLADHTRLAADITLPSLTAESFVDLYPLLPYQIDLIVQVVSGLRTQGGAMQHVGGANRTIIKIAQQLLINPAVRLAEKPIGTLATIDQVYDLVSGSIDSQLRGRIDEIGRQVPHPLAHSVAKAICLLQFVRSIHRTAENLAAVLHSAVDADSRLAEVRAALEALEKAHLVRRGDDGYRIPTPAEDDWERIRGGFTARLGDVNRLHWEALSAVWQPQPSHSLLEVQPFKAGLVSGPNRLPGDVMFQVTLAEAGRPYEDAVEQARQRSRDEPGAVFWVAATDGAIDRETAELHRSKSILDMKERSAKTKDETNLVDEEKRRLSRHSSDLQTLLRQALLGGTIFFRGNDRSPSPGTTTVVRAAEGVLAQALPAVYDRFGEAAARVRQPDLDALLTNDNLRGLPPVFSTLGLVRDEAGRPIIDADRNPLAEVLQRIANKYDYGQSATGAFLADELGREPFGWSFDAVRLFVVSLLRAGRIVATSRGQEIENALSTEAKATFSNNNLFRQASFRPKVGLDVTQLIDASTNFETVFGRQIADLQEAAVAAAIRDAIQQHEPSIQDAYTTLVRHGLPGADVLERALDQVRAIRTGSDAQAILGFNGAFRELKEALTRANDLAQALDAPHLKDVARARQALDVLWPVLRDEEDISDADRNHAERLGDLLARETFFRELPAIDQHARALEQEHARRHVAAADARAQAYADALARLKATPGWEQVTSEQQNRVAAPLAGCAGGSADAVSIHQLRSDLDACPARLSRAVEELLKLVDGKRVEWITAANYFSGGVETEEQLEAALNGLRERCVELIAAGKKVLVQ